MSERLTRLPWVDADTIKTDANKRQVRFQLKDAGRFSLDEVKQILGSRYNGGVKLLVGPDPPAPPVGAPRAGAAPPAP